MDAKNHEPVRTTPLQEATTKIISDLGQEAEQKECRVFYDQVGSWIYIDRFESPTHGTVGEVRVQQWYGDNKDLFLYLNLTDNFHGAFDLAKRLQGLGLPVTEIKPHAASWKSNDENKDLIDDLNRQLTGDWKKRLEESQS